jgi:hypothetical protein
MKDLLALFAHLLTTLAKQLGPGGAKAIVADNMRKTFATRLLSRGAAITDVQHLLGHASVKTTEKAYAAFVKNERFKQTIDLLDQPVVVLPENSNHAVSRRQPFVLMMQATDCQLKPVGPKYSCGFPMVIFQQPTQAFFTAD